MLANVENILYSNIIMHFKREWLSIMLCKKNISPIYRRHNSEKVVKDTKEAYKMVYVIMGIFLNCQ